MDEQRAPRRKKVVKTTHADVGQPVSNSRADVIRPHKRVTGSAAASAPAASAPNAAASNTVTVGQFISSFMASLKGTTLSDTVWGNDVAKRLASAQSLLSIPASDTVHLYSEVSVILRGKVALALCESGLRMRDVTGAVSTLPWKDLPGTKVGYQGTTLVVGSRQLAFHDAKVLAALLTQIQSKLA